MYEVSGKQKEVAHGLCTLCIEFNYREEPALHQRVTPKDYDNSFVALWRCVNCLHKDKNMTVRRTYSFLTDLRTAGVALILLCHFTRQSGSPYLVMSSQFFNIGNSVFFLISGLSFGIQGKIHSALK